MLNNIARTDPMDHAKIEAVLKGLEIFDPDLSIAQANSIYRAAELIRDLRTECDNQATQIVDLSNARSSAVSAEPVGPLGRENDAFHRALSKYPASFEALRSFWNDAFGNEPQTAPTAEDNNFVKIPRGPQNKVDEIVRPYLRQINSTPELLSLLYDIDMLPEQTSTIPGAIRLAAFCEVWKRTEISDRSQAASSPQTARKTTGILALEFEGWTFSVRAYGDGYEVSITDKRMESKFMRLDAEQSESLRQFVNEVGSAQCQAACAEQTALEAIASECDPDDPEWSNPAQARAYIWQVTQDAIGALTRPKCPTPSAPDASSPAQGPRE